MVYLYAGRENGLKWWSGLRNGLWNLHFSEQYLTLLCSYLLTNLLIVSSGLHSCSLLQVVGVKGHMQFNKLHRLILYIAS